LRGALPPSEKAVIPLEVNSFRLIAFKA